MPSDELDISLVDDYALEGAEREELRVLLAACFEGYFSDRTYYKQVPKARFLVKSGTSLVAHLAMEDRIIRVGEVPVRIFGVIDLCVAAAWRRQGIAARLLRRLESLARAHPVDFLVLFADEPALYEREGYAYVPNTTRWLAIDEHRSHAILEKPLGDCFMVKPLSERPWDPDAPVDLLGYLY